jgi:hypothetical protein
MRNPSVTALTRVPRLTTQWRAARDAAIGEWFRRHWTRGSEELAPRVMSKDAT